MHCGCGWDPPLAQPSVIAQALYRDQLYDLQPDENGGYQLQKPSAAFETGLQTDQWQQYGYNYGFGYGDDVNTEELFATARGPMLAASVGVHNEETQKRFQLADDRVRIFLYAEMPESLYAKLEYAARARYCGANEGAMAACCMRSTSFHRSEQALWQASGCRGGSAGTPAAMDRQPL